MASPELSPSPPVVELTLRPRRVLLGVFLACVGAEIAFFLLDWHVNYGRLFDLGPMRNMLNTTREDGLASWFGVTQTAFVALTLWLVVVTVRARDRTRWAGLGWMVVALIFSYMAFDDGAEFHERLGSTFKLFQQRASEAAAEPTAGSRLLELFPSYPWQVLFLPFFGAAGLFMLAFLWRRLQTRRARGLLLAGIGCFVVAVGIDFVEGLDEDHTLNVNRMIAELPGVEDYAYERFDRDGYEAVRHFGKSLEETTEMFGMTLLWVAFLGHWMHIGGNLRVRCAVDP
ncbi:MAG: hypothetical protein HKO59_06955 [Phycisphaerales bacterium]|nr:hypothetical protein [Phycisphaerae bacterium]NNM25714.1 hypothetical protein [Phycisphaerales bacterium]